MMPHLRLLRGVVHSPSCARRHRPRRPRLRPRHRAALPAPNPAAHPAVAGRPDGQAVADAVALLDRMIDGFAFVSKDHRANYLGALLTPLLRELAPPPYQLVAITAPQPGSGKTLLATSPGSSTAACSAPSSPATTTSCASRSPPSSTTPPDRSSTSTTCPAPSAPRGRRPAHLRPLGRPAPGHQHHGRTPATTGCGSSPATTSPSAATSPAAPSGSPSTPAYPTRTCAPVRHHRPRTVGTRAQRGALLHALLTLARAWVDRRHAHTAAALQRLVLPLDPGDRRNPRLRRHRGHLRRTRVSPAGNRHRRRRMARVPVPDPPGNGRFRTMDGERAIRPRRNRLPHRIRGTHSARLLCRPIWRRKRPGRMSGCRACEELSGAGCAIVRVDGLGG
jgi:hypothetical protein